ncbi:hypothetical protein [Candidatus Chlamydia corallus]|uniref:hypothetical protein n=1 Tax=Candidatus Chlamydia corallus TaxID=2038470 RepID=UPI000C2F954C|nr:hypothetical protein [Candidatus Chlamydia corallus]
MASSSNNSAQQNLVPSWVDQKVPWNRASNLNVKGDSLTLEAQTSRGWLAERRHFLEVLDANIEHMERNDLKKYSRYKIIIIITTLITLAIACIVPLSMVFGLPMWVPCLILFGAGLASTILAQRLRSKCKEIQLRYRAYQLSRQQLFNQYPDLRKSTLYKYNITHAKPKKGFMGRLLDNLRPDLHKSKDDGGASADSKLDFAGFGAKHYQVDALIGPSGVNSAEWRQIATQILNIKNDILNDKGEAEPIDKVQKSALEVGGEGIGKRIHNGSILDIARDLLTICGYGMNVGVEARKSIDQYRKWFFNSQTFMSWNQPLSSVAQGYLTSQERNLDYASKIFQDLVALTAAYGTAQALEDLDSLIRCYGQLVEAQDASKNTIALIHEKHLKLAMQDSCDQSYLEKWSNVYKVFSTSLREKEEGKLSEEEFLLRVGALRKELQKSKQNILGNHKTIPEHSKKAEKRLASYLLQIGNKGPFLTRMHKAISAGKSIQKNVEGIIAQHPEKRILSLRCGIEKLQGMLNRDDWGAVSQKSECETLVFELKNKMQIQLQGFRELLNSWEGKYHEFKKNKLAKVLFCDFTSSYPKLLNSLSELHAENSAESFVRHVDRISTELKAVITEINGNLPPTNPEEISLLAREYQDLMNELPLIVQEYERMQKEISSEGVSSGSMLLNSLLNKDDKIDKKIESSKQKLVAKAKQARMDARSLQNVGLLPLIERNTTCLLDILDNMRLFDNSMSDIHALDTETLIAASSKMFASMQNFDYNTYTNLLDVLEIQNTSRSPIESPEPLGNIPEEVHNGVVDHVVDHISATQRQHQDILKRRCADLENTVNQLQKSVNKWGLAKGIITGIIAVILCVLSAIFIGHNIVSLLVISCVGLLCTQVCPLFFDHMSKNKEFEKRVIETAQSLVPATKILPSEFNNKDLNRLAKLQDNLDLEGFGPAWARSIVHDLEGVKTKEKSLKDITKEFLKDAKNLDKRIKRRFKGQLRGEEPVGGPTVPHKRPAAEAFLELNRELERFQKRKEEINIQQDALVQECMDLCLEKSKYNNEKAHAATLTEKVGKLKTLEELEKENAHYVLIQNYLRSVIEEKLLHEKVQEIDIVKEAEELHKLVGVIYSNNSAKLDKQDAKKRFKEKILSIAGIGQLELLESYLHISASQGLCRTQMQASFRERILLNPKAAKEGEKERINASREEVLKTLGLSHLVPFVRFASPNSAQSGYSQILKAYELLSSISGSLQNQETVNPEDYSAARAALSSYVRKHESLIVSTYGLSSQEGEISSKVTNMMRDLYSLEELIAMGLESSRLNRSDQILHRMGSVLQSELLDNNVIELLEKLNEQNPNDPECQQYIRQLLEFPVSILYGAFKNAQNHYLLNFAELNTIRATRTSQEEALRYVEEKGKVFEPYWEESKKRLEEIAVQLNGFKNQEMMLEREIQLVNLKISIFNQISLQAEVSAEKEALAIAIQKLQELIPLMETRLDPQDNESQQQIEEAKQQLEDSKQELEMLEERLLQINEETELYINQQEQLMRLLNGEV